MEGKVKLLEHPVHPVLIAFPLGLLAIAVVFDVLRMIAGNGALSTVAF